MTKKFIKAASLLGLSMVLFSSCLKNMGNSQTVSGVLATVVSNSSTNGKVIIQIDGSYPYYYADEFMVGEEELEYGDRIFLNTTTVNWDDQEVAAEGSFRSPLKMTAVNFVHIDSSFDQDSDALEQNDSISIINPPMIAVNRAGIYMTFTGKVPSKSNPNFRLIRKESRMAEKEGQQDTAVFELKTIYKEDVDTKNTEGFIHSFKLNATESSYSALDSAQIVLVEVAAKIKIAPAGYNTTDSTYTFMGHRVSPSINW